MATIRCIDVADSDQFVAELAELRSRGGRSFAASLLELWRKARPPFGKSSGELGSPELRMHLLVQNNHCALTAPPGMTRSFFFVCRSKTSRLLRAKENDEGVAALLDACGGSIVD